MKRMELSRGEQELDALCSAVRELTHQKKYQECENLIEDAMGKYPHAPQPHNLYGLLLEKEGDHLTAMKHFRAAWALAPTYIPARHNLERFSSFYPKGVCAFDETDCPMEPEKDRHGVAHDEDGVGRADKGDSSV